MLQAHSFLWHYLWVAPNVLLLVLGFVIWRRGIAKQIPAFLAFACLSAISELTVYAADVMPFITAWTYWRIVWASLLVEGVLKFVLFREIFARVVGPYASVARLGKFLIWAVGVVLGLIATLAAAYAPQDSRFGIISGAYKLYQAIYLIESGVLVFIFLFASYFRLSWVRAVFGITLGLSISACVHLATWALLVNGSLPDPKRLHLVFVKMGTYHICVLIWFYYLLVPEHVAVKSAVPLPKNNLAV